MRIVILDALTYGDTSLEGFKALGEVVIYPTTSPQEVCQRVADAEVIVTNKVVMDAHVIASAPMLRLICVAATGTNNIDHDAARARGIEVRNVRNYSTESVVQHTLSMVLYLMNTKDYYDTYVRSGAWSASEVFTHIGPSFEQISSKRWGIIALGAIGERVAQVAQALGAQVWYYSTSGVHDHPTIERVSLSRLLEQSDIISIHAPLTEATHHLIGHSELLMMRDHAILLNLGRGGIIDEEALAIIMEVKPLRVGLDVLEVEPIRADHPLLRLSHPERLYITPHIAWTSVQAREHLIQGCIMNIQNGAQ